jgi:uncharacterized protein YceK
MKKVLIAVAVLAISGCANVGKTYTPDGRKGYTVDCGGPYRGWNMCYESAGELCKEAGYDILDKTSESVSSASFTGNSANTVSSMKGKEEKTFTRTMVVICKKS